MPSQAKSGGSRKIGRNVPKCKLYRARGTRFSNKLKRILKSNGEDAASAYRRAHVRGQRAAV